MGTNQQSDRPVYTYAEALEASSAYFEGDELAAVKKLSDRARVLEGNLHVESKPGAGTTLRLSVKRTNLMATKKTSHE